MRWLAALLLSVWLACGTQAQTFVQNAGNQSAAAAASVSVSFTAIGSGNLVVGSAGWAASGTGTCTGGGGITATVKDNNNVAATVIDTITDNVNAGCLATFYFPNVTNGATSLTLTPSTTDTFLSITMQEWSGIATTTPLDVHTGNVVAAATTVTSNTVTPSANGELIFGAVYFDNGSSAVTSVGSPFTLRNNETGIPSADESAVQGTAAAIGSTFTSAGNGGPIAVAAFKAAAGGGPTCPQTLALMGVGC